MAQGGRLAQRFICLCCFIQVTFSINFSRKLSGPFQCQETTESFHIKFLIWDFAAKRAFLTLLEKKKIKKINKTFYGVLHRLSKDNQFEARFLTFSQGRLGSFKVVFHPKYRNSKLGKYSKMVPACIRVPIKQYLHPSVNSGTRTTQIQSYQFCQTIHYVD